MGDDLMGSTSSKPPWAKINDETQTYSRSVKYINGNNKIYERNFNCSIQKDSQQEEIEIWSAKFQVTKFDEICIFDQLKVKNTYYLDSREIVRKSIQYHSDSIGYLFIERLDLNQVG